MAQTFRHHWLVVGVPFLEPKSYHFTVSEEAAAQAVLELAAGTISEKGICEFLRANMERAQRHIKRISDAGPHSDLVEGMLTFQNMEIIFPFYGIQALTVSQ